MKGTELIAASGPRVNRTRGDLGLGFDQGLDNFRSQPTTDHSSAANSGRQLLYPSRASQEVALVSSCFEDPNEMRNLLHYRTTQLDELAIKGIPVVGVAARHAWTCLLEYSVGECLKKRAFEVKPNEWYGTDVVSGLNIDWVELEARAESVLVKVVEHLENETNDYNASCFTSLESPKLEHVAQSILPRICSKETIAQRYALKHGDQVKRRQAKLGYKDCGVCFSCVRRASIPDFNPNPSSDSDSGSHPEPKARSRPAKKPVPKPSFKVKEDKQGAGPIRRGKQTARGGPASIQEKKAAAARAANRKSDGAQGKFPYHRFGRVEIRKMSANVPSESPWADLRCLVARKFQEKMDVAIEKVLENPDRYWKPML